MGLENSAEGVGRAQLVFARWVDIGTKLGLALLICGFAAYVSGLMPPHFPIEDLPKHWGLPLKDFMEATGAPRGWGWLQLIERGDYVNFIGMGVLATIVVVSYVRVVPLLLRSSRIYAAIAVIEIIVLAVAASGLLNGLGLRH